MARYIVKRLLWMIIVIWGVITIAFILGEITPGDAAQSIGGSSATEDQVQAIRESLGLDKSAIMRYFTYLKNLVTKLDFGMNFRTSQPVLSELLSRFPYTLKIALVGVLITIIIGIPLGILSAVKQYTWIDNVSMVFSLLGVSIPSFWLALIFINVFAVSLGILPASGLFAGWVGYILPCATLGVNGAAMLARTTRSSMLEVIRQDYIQTAKAKGQIPFKIIMGHGLRNALIPIVTVIGTQLGNLLGGAIIAESIFSIPGTGSYLLDAIYSRNTNVVLGAVIFIAVIYSLINLIIDLLYAVIDPSLKSSFVSPKRAKKKKILAGSVSNG